jgi:hypothetical protein
VLWRWSDTPPCLVSVIDDFGQRPKAPPVQPSCAEAVRIANSVMVME